MFELSKEFRFEAAHTLQETTHGEGSRRIHGHSYRAEIVIRGRRDPISGMVVDVGRFEQMLSSAQAALDHRFLDEINDLGPATMENLADWIWRRLAENVAGLHRVTIHRDSLHESCTYFGPEERHS